MLRANAFSREQPVFIQPRKSSPSNAGKEDYTRCRCVRSQGKYQFPWPLSHSPSSLQSVRAASSGTSLLRGILPSTLGQTRSASVTREGKRCPHRSLT